MNSLAPHAAAREGASIIRELLKEPPADVITSASRYEALREMVGSNWVTSDGHSFIIRIPDHNKLFIGGNKEAFDAVIDDYIKENK